MLFFPFPFPQSTKHVLVQHKNEIILIYGSLAWPYTVHYKETFGYQILTII